MTMFQIRGRQILQEKILSALDDKFTVTEQDVDTIAFEPLTMLIMKSQSKSKQRGSSFCPNLKRMVKYIFQIIDQKVGPKPYIDHRHTEEPFPEREFETYPTYPLHSGKLMFKKDKENKDRCDAHLKKKRD